MVLRDNHQVAKLRREGWFSSNTEATVNDDKITFVSTSILGKKFNILKNTRQCGNITCHWTGKVTICLNRSDGKGQDKFTLKNTEWFGGSYALRDNASQKLFEIKGKMSWASWKTNYTVREFDHGYVDEAVNELLVYCTYALKMHVNQSSGVY